ncbi:MAG: STAS domain-containing protein [Waddliaceae bacterium]
MMGSNIDIESESQGDIRVIKLKGRIDHMTAPSAEEYLKKFLLKGNKKVILDLAELHYISSVGLRVLVMFSDKIQAVEGKLALCSPRPNISNLLKMTKFDELFLIFDTEKDALHALSDTAP